MLSCAKKYRFILVLTLITSLFGYMAAGQANAAQLEPIKKVEIKGTIVLVNGKPFFPLGITHAAHHHKALKEVGAAGFNCVGTWTYDMKDPLSFRQDVRDAYTNGMYASVSFHGMVDDIEMVKKIVQACKDEPGLLAWELPDEPNLRLDEPADKPYAERPYRWSPAKLQAMYDAIKSIDKKHPVWVNLAHFYIDDHKDYNPCADIMAADVYPVPGVPLEAQAAYCDITVVGCAGKPAWQYVQMSPVRPELGTKDRHPTIEEVRCLCYMSVVHKITGLLFYAFNERPGGDWRINETASDYWAQWPALLSELKSLSQFFTAPEAPGNVTVKQTQGAPKGSWGFDALHVSLRKLNDEYLLIAVNGLNEEIKADIALPVSVKKAVVVSEKRKITVANNTISDAWLPQAVHLYRFKK